MQIFSISNETLNEVKELPFKLEREIQTLFEKNLTALTGLTLVKSEFALKGKRIDTLAYDEETKAFIIIEYKRDKNYSVVDQGFAYLSLMLENKADFILEYNERLNKTMKRDDVDWSQSRIMFVSPYFTENQIQSTNFRDLAIELWQVKRFSNQSLLINQIKKSNQAESIKPLTKQNEELKQVTNEIIVYSEQDHLNNADEAIKELYEKFKNALLNLSPDFEIKPAKVYIAFKRGKNIVDIVPQKKSLKIWINTKFGTLQDGKELARNVSNIGHHGNGDYEIIFQDDSELEYILSLVKQIL